MKFRIVDSGACYCVHDENGEAWAHFATRAEAREWIRRQTAPTEGKDGNHAHPDWMAMFVRWEEQVAIAESYGEIPEGSLKKFHGFRRWVEARDQAHTLRES